MLKMSENLKKLDLTFGFQPIRDELEIIQFGILLTKSEIFLNNYTMNYFFFTLTRQFTKYKIKKLS